jgi:RNA recognition motif-containing protein
VANLPFQFSDEELKTAFEGFQVKTAKVVKRRFGTRTKGFGFVDFESEEEQLRALKEVHGKQVEGRDLQLKIAIQEDEQKDGEAVDANVEAESTPA